MQPNWKSVEMTGEAADSITTTREVEAMAAFTTLLLSPCITRMQGYPSLRVGSADPRSIGTAAGTAVKQGTQERYGK
ncbi:hypothetical protein C2E25_09155 [Geothermobacter hydrogeniphilus]|uniref:Uncharacterized protein n=1 Tax=Geothermobacter hydrogeniphilus TaxID=1969733 RepID=A0A2K2H9S9_9BACT|nr:hypothetical protein C2E25_09155 [Geothermobacter hydrogeniphilus]